MNETAQSRWGPGTRRRGDQPAAIFIVGAAGSGAEPLARALASLRDCSALGEEPAPVADLGRDGDRREGTAGHAGAAAIRTGEHVTTVVDGAPKRALQVPRLAEVYEEARFVLCRRPAVEAATIALAGWQSGRHVSHPDLEGWRGPAWSYALIPGWRRLQGSNLGAIVAEQWTSTMRIALGDLDKLPPGAWSETAFDSLMDEPEAALQRVAKVCGIEPVGSERSAPAMASDLERLTVPPGPPPAELESVLAELSEAEERLAAS